MNRACLPGNTTGLASSAKLNLHEQNQHASCIRPVKTNLIRMKRIIFILLLSAGVPLSIFSQTDALISKCVMSTGENTTYLKDFVVELPKASVQTSIPVHKENMYLMKNMKYRFTLCNQDNSKGELILSVFDGEKQVTSTFIEKTGKIYSSVDFICNKTGLYQLRYTFKEGEQGIGVGIVSMIK